LIFQLLQTLPLALFLITSNGKVSVQSGTPAGEYSFFYKICLKSDPEACSIAKVTVTVASADLEIVKTASITEVEQGQSFVYTLTVTNNGPSMAANVEVSDILSTNLSVLSYTVVGGSWNNPTWLIENMASGDVATLTIAVETSASFTGNIDNTATVSSSTYDPVTTNNSYTVSVNVTETVPVINNFPATGFGTLAFEDLWPGKGDYDFNDLVLDYKFEITTNSSNYINEVVGTFVIKAFGAGLENGFWISVIR